MEGRVESARTRSWRRVRGVIAEAMKRGGVETLSGRRRWSEVVEEWSALRLLLAAVM